MTQKINFNLIQKILYWIVLIWFPKVPDSVDHSRTWINQVAKWNKENGPIWTIAYIKMIKQIVMSYLSDNPQKEVKMIIGINRINGLPKQITYLHELIESKDPIALRFVFTLLSISRTLPGWKDPDLSTLIKPSGANPIMERKLSLHIPLFLSEYNFNLKLKTYFDVSDLHYSNKSGPIGRATRDALMDLKFMPEILKTILMSTSIRSTMIHYDEIFKTIIVEKWYLVTKYWNNIKLPFDFKFKDKNYLQFKNRSYQDRVEMVMDTNNKFRKDPSSYHVRRLSVVKDPEAKSRIIAIFDYWSQTWLKQIHSIHFNFLRTIPTDRTFTQCPTITNKPEGHKYYSFDLSAATDRFPITFQEMFIKECFGEQTAIAWRMILTSFPFYVPWEDRTITYNCGQPMGAYSSWSTFTLSHHVVLHYIHHTLNLKEKFYMILGDDIVIYHDEVAKMYQDIMKQLDVGISIPKSCISSNMYEFAKRIFINGKEVSGIQIGGLYNNVNKYHLLYQSIYEIVFTRLYTPHGNITIPSLFRKLWEILGKDKRRIENLCSRISLLHSFNKYLLGDKTLLEEYLIKLYPHYEGQLHFHDVVNLNNYVYLSINTSIESKQAEYINFADDLLKSPDIINPATWGFADSADIWTSPIWFVTQTPIFRSLGNVIDALSRAKKLDSFKEMIEVLALPSPSVFQDRASTRLIGAKAKLAKRFLAEFEASVIRGQPATIPSINLGGSVLRKASNDINQIISSFDKTTGLLPGPQSAPPKMTFSSNINDYI
jgi:hypothetical protein